MADETKKGPVEPAASWPPNGLPCHDQPVVERAETPEADPGGPAADAAVGGEPAELTERPEVQQLLAEMKADLKPGEDPLYYDWTNDSAAEGSEKAYVSAAKPARARHITIDAKKVKIAASARNPARLAKTERIIKGAPVPGAIAGVAGPAAVALPSEPAAPAVSSDAPVAAALPSEPAAPTVGSDPPAATAVGSDPPAAAAVGSDASAAPATASDSGAGTSEPPASDGASPWRGRGEELLDEVSQDDLPSAHLPALAPQPASSSGPPPAASTAEPEQRGRGMVIAIALLALLGVLLLWWLAAPGDGAAEDESDGIAVPGDSSEPRAGDDPEHSGEPGTDESAAAASAASPAGAAGGSAGEHQETSSTADTATARPAPSAATTTRPTPQVSTTHSKPELVEH